VACVEEDLSALAAALRAVPGVAAAQFDATDPSSVRLVLDPDADGLVVAEAVSQLLHARLGHGADMLRVVEADALEPDAAATDALAGDDDGPEEAPRPSVPEQRAARPGIVRLDVAVTDRESLAHVVLSGRSGAAAGDATSTATSRGQHRAVAAATVVAVEELVHGRVRIELDHVEIATHGADRTALVGLTLVALTGAERLSGSAVVREDESRAIVRAVLDALNRRIEAWLR
jgi:hypothetical protein